MVRVNNDSNAPGKYNYDIVTYGDPNNFVVNDNYNITLVAENNQFEIKANAVFFVLKGQVLDYGQEVGEFDYDVLFNGTKIENLTISNDGWITLQSYVYNEGEPEEVRITNKIKPTISVDTIADAESDGYYKRYQVLLDYVFDSNNEGFEEDRVDTFFNVSYNSTSPAYVCYNKVDLVVKPFAENPDDLVKTYNNDNSNDAFISMATCTGFIEGETSYADVFNSIRFKKLDVSTLVGTYPLELVDFTFKPEKDFYNVIMSDEVVYYEITKREIEIAPNENQTKVYGSENKDIAYFVTNLANGDTVRDVIYAISISKGIGEDVGEYSYKLDSITINPNYSYTFNNMLADGITENKFKITKRTLTITAVSQSVVYGENVNTLNYVVSVDNPEGETFLAQYKPLIIGSPETEAKKYSLVGNYDITKGTLDAGPNFNIVFVEGKVSVLKKSATFTVLANEISAGTIPNVENIEYSFEGLIEGTVPEINLNILPDNEDTPTKYALSGEVYGKNNVTSALTFNYKNTYNTLRLVFNGENVFDCYDISIKSTVAFYVGSLVLNISVVGSENNSSSIVTTTYDGTTKNDSFTLACDNDEYIITAVAGGNNYNFIYKKPGVDEALAEPPTNAGTYSVGIDLTSIKVTKKATGETVTPTLNISSYGSLTINKANLYYKTNEDKPTIAPMEFGSTVLPTELKGKKISDTPLEYEDVQVFLDEECTTLVNFGVKATYNTEIYSENYIKSLTVQGSPYTVSMMIIPEQEADQANYNPVAINFDLIITPQLMTVAGATFTYAQGIRSTTYSNKVVNNSLTLSVNEEYADKIGVSYSYVGVNYNSTNPDAYGLLAYYEEEIYVGDTSNVKYIQRTELAGANFSHDPVKNYILASKGSNNYYLPLTHLSGVPINAGIYFVVANIRSTNGNYALSTDAQLQFETIFEITRSEDFEINNWVEEFMFGISDTEIMESFSFTTNPSRVKAYCSIVYELGDDILYLENSNIIAICPEDQTYSVKVIVSSPNYFQEKDMSFKIVQLDAVISFPAADKYHYTGSEVFSFIQNTKVTLYNFDGSIDIVVYDKFSEIGPFGEAPMQVKYFHAFDEDADGTPETIGEELTRGPIDVGYYYIECVYNDRTYYGTNSAYFEITKTYYAGAISLENASFAYDPFLSTDRSDTTGKPGLYQWIYDNMIKIPVDELPLVDYKRTAGAAGDPRKQIHLAVVMQNGDELKVGPDGIKDCGTYTIRLILSFSDHITQTTTSEATLTINRVALSTDAFKTGTTSFTYDGHYKYNELSYLGATTEPTSVPVVGYKQFALTAGETKEGWYGYFNGDPSNFCIIYNYLKYDEGTSTWKTVSKVNTNDAPIVPGRYKCSYDIIAGNNYLIQNTVIPDSEFTINVTTLDSTNSSSLSTVYDGSDKSYHQDLKLTFLNSNSAEIVITYVYSQKDESGNTHYYEYNGGEILLTEDDYDETKGLVFEKYFYKYTVWDNIETGRVLDTENVLSFNSIINAGYYKVLYKLVYPVLGNYEKFLDISPESYNIYTDPTHSENRLDSLLTIKPAPFSVISNDLRSEELGISFANSSGFNYEPIISEESIDADGTLIDSPLSSIDSPIATMTQGKISISVTGSGKDFLTLTVYDKDNFIIEFDKVGDTYTSRKIVPVGSYYFVLSHKKDELENFYNSAPCFFRVVAAQVELSIKSNDMEQDATTGTYKLKDSDLMFRDISSDLPKVILEYNKTSEFEDNVKLNKWLKAGSMANPTFTIQYYQEKGCLNRKPGSITTFDAGTPLFAKINIDSTEYSVKSPLVLEIIINPTLDYTITVDRASFGYKNYTDTSLSVTAKYSVYTIYGKQIFFSDDSNLTPEYKALMQAFADETPGDYKLRGCIEVIDSVAGVYDTVGFFIPTSTNYLPKAFGYRYSVSAKELEIKDIYSITVINPITVNTNYTTTWDFAPLTILSYPNHYTANIILTDNTELKNINISFSPGIIVYPEQLKSYFANPDTFDWATIGTTVLSFESGDYIFSSYLSNITNNKLTIPLVKPSLNTVLNQINTVSNTYTGTNATLDLKTLSYTSVDVGGGTYPIQAFNDIAEKIYGGNISGKVTVSSNNMTLTAGANYEYNISNTTPGDYSFVISFDASDCFAATDFEVTYKITKLSASLITDIRYEYAAGEYIENVTRLYVDTYGLIKEDNVGRFYIYNEDTQTYTDVGTSFDNSKFQVKINGVWYSLADNNYIADIGFFTSDYSMSAINTAGVPKTVLRAEDYISEKLFVKIKLTFNENSVVEGSTIIEFIEGILYVKS